MLLKPAHATKPVVLTLSLALFGVAAYAATVVTPAAPGAKPAVPNAKPAVASVKPASAKPAAPSVKPASDGASWQVAKGIDHIIQPRFQRNAGQFGLDRIATSLDGHPNADIFTRETRSEKRQFKRIVELNRPFIIGILHCAHKPGSHVGEDDRGEYLRDLRPFAQSLVTANTSDDRAKSTWGWAREHLNRIAVPYTHRIRRGHNVDTIYGKWDVAIRPIRAEHGTCLSCHVGAKRGDTLGAMIYVVQRKRSNGKPIYYSHGGGV